MFLRFGVGFLAALAIAGIVLLMAPPPYIARAAVRPFQAGMGPHPIPTFFDCFDGLAPKLVVRVAERYGLFADPEFRARPLGRDVDARAHALTAIQRRLRCESMSRVPGRVIVFEHTRPERAAVIANAFAMEYVALETERIERQQAEADAWFRNRHPKLRAELAAAESALTAFNRARLTPSGGPDVRLRELEQTVEGLRRELQFVPPSYAEWRRNFEARQRAAETQLRSELVAAEGAVAAHRAHMTPRDRWDRVKLEGLEDEVSRLHAALSQIPTWPAAIISLARPPKWPSSSYLFDFVAKALAASIAAGIALAWAGRKHVGWPLRQ